MIDSLGSELGSDFLVMVGVVFWLADIRRAGNSLSGKELQSVTGGRWQETQAVLTKVAVQRDSLYHLGQLTPYFPNWS